MKYTPENITKLKPNQVFVFGSNLAGRHGAGAALTAKKLFGAVQGKGSGLHGQSYALPTKTSDLRQIPMKTLAVFIEQFIQFAIEHPELEFLVTKVGCGLAGHTTMDVGPLFHDMPKNVVLPKEFCL